MFEKTIENIRKRKNIELVNTFFIYNENLFAVELNKESVYFNTSKYT